MTNTIKLKGNEIKANDVKETKKHHWYSGLSAKVSRIGKALLFPIAMLPVAAILLRIGSAIPDTTVFSKFIGSWISAGGNAIFSNLPILFAIGVGFGLSKDSRGEAAIVSFATMALLMILMSDKTGTFGGADIVDKIYGTIKFSVSPGGEAGGTGFHRLFGGKYNAILAGNVLNGILVGGFVAYIYNKFNGLELPSVLGFFSGRRLIPVLGIMGGLLAGILYAIIFPWIGYVLVQLSWLLQKGTGNRWTNSAIMGIYGFVNRLLIPFGMHHIPNTLFWFQLGDFTTASGGTVHGDINGFLQGIPKGNHAGTFQSGFFPIMMFGLPALVAAIWFTADKDQRVKVVGLLGGAAVVSFFTGITEPIEFAFLFAAPMLFFMHAILTGFFGLVTGLFGIQLGFGFSAGLIDYILSIPKSMDIINANKTGINAIMANPGWIWVIGAVTAATYFFLSTFLIKKFNLNTPGRGTNAVVEDQEIKSGNTKRSGNHAINKYTELAATLLAAVGGKENVKQLEWCATRLRWVLKDSSLVDKEAIKQTSAMGQIKIGEDGYQIIIGPKVEMVGNAINEIL